MYTLDYYHSSIPVSEYFEKYVDIPAFLEACKACPNYGCVWSCPPYDFDVSDYWHNYSTLKLLAVKITFDEESVSCTYPQEELNRILNDTLFAQKQHLSDLLFEEEKKFPGSISLSAGSCQCCPNGCTRSDAKPCRHIETLRYSLESLGANVGLTIEKLMGLELEWMEEGKLPSHFVLVSGLLIP
ncbi:MAG: DUF2284 domain-containing protein [Eubacteriales bacterium]|nr:DUF2284 domain-containing protein [Eubacteriales bacterium]